MKNESLTNKQTKNHNRETNSAVICVIQQMSIKPPSLFCNSNNQPLS